MPPPDAASASGVPDETGAAVRLARLDEESAWLAHLGPEEARRAAEIANATVRARFVVSRGLRRSLLAGCTGHAAGELEFEEEPGEKPRLTDARGWDFNISHAGDHVVVAAARGPVGIDIERIRPVGDMAAIVQRYFHPDECAAWSGLAEECREEAFFLLWSAREAAMKCASLGLAKGIAVTRVEPAIIARASCAAHVAGRTLRLWRLDAPPGCVMFLARGGEMSAAPVSPALRT